jgi:hypothetical protein
MHRNISMGGEQEQGLAGIPQSVMRSLYRNRRMLQTDALRQLGSEVRSRWRATAVQHVDAKRLAGSQMLRMIIKSTASIAKMHSRY